MQIRSVTNLIWCDIHQSYGISPFRLQAVEDKLGLKGVDFWHTKFIGLSDLEGKKGLFTCIKRGK